MQPYFFPFLGYYQLVSSVDYFISYNDVNFIERGWINRNNILAPAGKQLFTIPLVGASSNKLIMDISIADINKWKTSFLKTIYFTYKKAPFFESSYHLVEDVLSQGYDTIDKVATQSIERVFSYIGLNKEIKLSSELDYNRDGNKVEKIISLVSFFDAKTIHFPSGSKLLYKSSDFRDDGYITFAVMPNLIPYAQFNKNNFEAGLSIIDVLMFNDKETIISYFNAIKTEPLDE